MILYEFRLYEGFDIITIKAFCLDKKQPRRKLVFWIENQKRDNRKILEN